MNILEKANELGLLLAESDEFKRVAKAQIAQDTDDEAKAVIHNYNTVREELLQKAQAKDIKQEDFMKLREQMQAEYDKLTSNATVKELMDAMEAFNTLMENVNKAISRYVVPEQGGCSGSCSSCSGCN